MSDCPNYDHADYPGLRSFNPFGEQEPVEPNDRNETGDQQVECDHNEMVRDPVGKFGYWMCAKCFRPYGSPHT